MRKIEFRGKRVDGAGWAFGDLLQIKNCNPRIIPGNFWHLQDFMDNTKKFKVIPESVGQATGVTVADLKRLFEHDICKWGEHIGVIEWEQQAAAFWFKYKEGKINRYKPLHVNFSDGDIYLNDSIEILGNLTDTPELIKTNK